MTKLIGKYELGLRDFKLYASTHHCSGSANLRNCEIFVGCSAEWKDTVNVLMHEALEVALIDNNCRYVPNMNYGQSDDQFMFIMSHPQFSQSVAQAAEFVTQVLPDLMEFFNAKSNDEVNDVMLHEIEEVIAADDSQMGQIACKLLVEYQKLKYELNDPRYQYSGRATRMAIVSRNAIIDKLRMCDEQIVLKALDIMKAPIDTRRTGDNTTIVAFNVIHKFHKGNYHAE